MLISCEQVSSSWVPTLSSVHCRTPLCCFCQQLSAAPLSSFHTRLTSLQGSVFVAVSRHLLQSLAGRTSPGVFCLASRSMSCLCCIRPAAELPFPHLVLCVPSPPIERLCPSPALNSPYGWWYLVLQY